MHRLDCPNCGRRPIEEFAYGGEPPDVPEAIVDPDERDFDQAWLRTNPEGIAVERWFHAAGCRRWTTVRRDRSADRAGASAG